MTGEISIAWQIIADNGIETDESKDIKGGEKKEVKKPMTPEEKTAEKDQLLKLVSGKRYLLIMLLSHYFPTDTTGPLSRVYIHFSTTAAKHYFRLF